MTQGKIERCHRSMKNLVQLQTFPYPRDLEEKIGSFVNYTGLRSWQATTTSDTMDRQARSRLRTPISGEPPRLGRDERRSNAK
jgi:hypothetical protein